MKQILLGIICALVGVSSFGQTAKQRIDYLKTFFYRHCRVEGISKKKAVADTWSQTSRKIFSSTPVRQRV